MGQHRPAAVLFDLGNTLAAYYRRDEFAPILRRAVAAARDYLVEAGHAVGELEPALARAAPENREAADFRFAPLGERLARIFELRAAPRGELDVALCARFLEPIFAVGRVYSEALPVLARLRAGGYRTAIVSNAPWGSPPELWRRELRRLGLAELVDAVVMCGDVGWRKPAPRIFEHACERLGVRGEECWFVGDELEWDMAGSAAVGMRPVLVDREGRHPAFSGLRIRNLDELASLLP